jgi:hypothetical protein
MKDGNAMQLREYQLVNEQSVVYDGWCWRYTHITLAAEMPA